MQVYETRGGGGQEEFENLMLARIVSSLWKITARTVQFYLKPLFIRLYYYNMIFLLPNLNFPPLRRHFDTKYEYLNSFILISQLVVSEDIRYSNFILHYILFHFISCSATNISIKWKPHVNLIIYAYSMDKHTQKYRKMHQAL